MATWDRYADAETALEVETLTGPAFYIRSFCDDSTQGVYVTKAPVCKLSLDPLVQFANTNIAWDISNSRSATGTLDTFDITWGGTTDIGNLAAQDWAIDPKSGNVQFTTAGTYTVTATVTDTLGNKSKPVEIEVNIVVNDYAYVGTTNAGLFLIDTAGNNSQANTGLTGNHINFRSVRLNPWYKDQAAAKRHLWACTQDGVAYSTDGAANWSLISKATLGTPVNDAGDSPVPATADLDQIDLAFSPQDPDTVFVLRSTATRIWVYKTTDYGTTWTNYQPGLGTAVAIADFVAFDANTGYTGGILACSGLAGYWFNTNGAGFGTVQFYYPTAIEWSSVTGIYTVSIQSPQPPATVAVEIQLWRGDAGPWEEQFDTINQSVLSDSSCQTFTSTEASGGTKYFGLKLVASVGAFEFPYVNRVEFPGWGQLTHSAGGLPGAII